MPTEWPLIATTTVSPGPTFKSDLERAEYAVDHYTREVSIAENRLRSVTAALEEAKQELARLRNWS